MASNSFKVVFLGDGGVGKSTYLQRMRNGSWSAKYVCTLGVEVHTLVFNTNYGPHTISVWDTAGQEKFGGMRAGYYVGAHGAMIFYSDNPMSRNNIFSWAQDMVPTTGDLPLVVVRTKSDVAGVILPDTIPISTKTQDNLDTPFTILLRMMTGHADLEITHDVGPIEEVEMGIE